MQLGRYSFCLIFFCGMLSGNLAAVRDFTRHEELLAALETVPRFKRARRAVEQAIAAARVGQHSSVELKFWLKAIEILDQSRSLTSDALDLYLLCQKEERDIGNRKRLRVFYVVAVAMGIAGFMWLHHMIKQEKARTAERWREFELAERAREREVDEIARRAEYIRDRGRDRHVHRLERHVNERRRAASLYAPPVPVIHYRENDTEKNAQMIERAFDPDAGSCSICAEGFEPGQQVACWDCRCNGVFHRRCAEGWNRGCPVCRQANGINRFSTALPGPTQYLEDVSKTCKMTAKAVIGGECPHCMEEFNPGDEVACWNCACGYTVHLEDAEKCVGGCPQCRQGAGENRYHTTLKEVD